MKTSGVFSKVRLETILNSIREKTYGKLAWLVNGLLWAYLVNFIMKWNLISFLPGMLVTPFIAQKTKNTWVSLLIHGIPNTILWIIFLTGILEI